MREKEMTMPPERGIAPPLRPVPAPRPTIGMPCSAAIFTIAATSSVVRGNTTSSGPRLVDAAVVFVKRQVFGPVEITARPDYIFDGC